MFAPVPGVLRRVQGAWRALSLRVTQHRPSALMPFSSLRRAPSGRPISRRWSSVRSCRTSASIAFSTGQPSLVIAGSLECGGPASLLQPRTHPRGRQQIDPGPRRFFRIGYDGPK
jgi:hypothetical protein